MNRVATTWLTALTALPLAANEITVTTTHLDDHAYKLGQYSGLTDEGFNSHVDLDLSLVDGNSSIEVSGRNLGLGSERLVLNYTFADRLSAFIDYQQIPNNRSADLLTVFRGEENLTLPEGWVAGPLIANLTQLNASLTEFDRRTDRDHYGAGVEVVLTDAWRLFGTYERQSKDGTDLMSGIFGTSGGNMLGMLMPNPIDWHGDTFDIGARYRQRDLTLDFGYQYSTFQSEVHSLTFQNPFATADVDYDPIANYPSGFGAIAPMPDNDAHRVWLSGALGLGQSSRLSFQVARAVLQQDDAFLDYTINPGLSVTSPLPRSSLDGEVEVTDVTVAFTMRPLPKATLRTRLTWQDRSNDTPRDAYALVQNDTADQDGDPTTDAVRVNRPYSRERVQSDVEFGYRLPRRMKLTGSVGFERIDRDFQEANRTDETTVGLRLDVPIGDALSTSIDFERAARDAEGEQSNRGYLAGRTLAYEIANGADAFDNDPFQRRFYLADRDRDVWRLRATWVPAAAWSLGAQVRLVDDDFTDSPIGLTRRETRELGVDLAYAPNDRFAAHASSSLARGAMDHAGYQWRSGETPIPPGRNPSNDWFQDSEDEIVTVSIGFEWAMLPDELTATFDYLHHDADTEYETTTTGIPVSQFPNLTADSDSVGLALDWHAADNLDLGVQYRFERYRSADFAIDGIGVTNDARIIYVGDTGTDFDVDVVSLRLRYSPRR